MNARSWVRRSLKALHEIAALGIGGGLVACLVLDWTVTDAASPNFAGARKAIAVIAQYVLVPSMVLVLVTGLLAIAVTKGFHDAGWAWVKALSGLSVFEATLVTVGASREPGDVAALAADPSLLTSFIHAERNTLLLLVGLCVANIVLAVWRPRLTYKVR